MSSKIRNPFSKPGIGKKYDDFRPRYHHIPVSRIFERLGNSVSSVLDVACGTGHSTVALAERFKNVTGCDLSLEMLKQARENSAITFVEADAATLPFADSEFSLVTVFMGFHWFNQAKFLEEARRVLKKPGFLAIDDYGFSGSMIANLEFRHFYKEYYFKNFPAPTRNSDSLKPDEMINHRFKLIDEFIYTHILEMSVDRFVSFLLTQSNLLSVTHFDENELRELLVLKFATFFADREQKLEFGGSVRLYETL
jgi:ubiquinone/menaquinone biosynthesis C-methylase UbiE